MKNIEKINERVSVETINLENRTIIIIVEDGDRIVACDLKTDDSFWCGEIHDENYIIVYSRGCMQNQIPLKIETVYNLKSNKFINIDKNKKISDSLEYMYMVKRGFSVPAVLTVINENFLNVINNDLVKELIDYLTNSNKEICKEEVVNYILKEYPVLRKFTNLPSDITVKEYRDVIDEIGTNILYFNKMPQIIDNGIKDDSLYDNYLNIKDNRYSGKNKRKYLKKHFDFY